MRNLINGILILACFAMAACSQHPIVATATLNPLSVAGIKSVSMGEIFYSHYTCPCSEVYIAKKEIRIDGLPSISAGTLWVARYVNSETGEKYLINDGYHNQLALVLSNERINPSRAVVQFDGMKRHRVWSLELQSDSNSIGFHDYLPGQSWWLIQYIGLDKSDKNILRFTIETKFQSEVIGQVEYTHNLANGNDFVVKGVRFRILQAKNDSTLIYQIL